MVDLEVLTVMCFVTDSSKSLDSTFQKYIHEVCYYFAVLVRNTQSDVNS